MVFHHRSVSVCNILNLSSWNLATLFQSEHDLSIWVDWNRSGSRPIVHSCPDIQIWTFRFSAGVWCLDLGLDLRGNSANSKTIPFDLNSVLRTMQNNSASFRGKNEYLCSWYIHEEMVLVPFRCFQKGMNIIPWQENSFSCCLPAAFHPVAKRRYQAVSWRRKVKQPITFPRRHEEQNPRSSVPTQKAQQQSWLILSLVE